MKQCSVDTCTNHILAKGLCSRHYQQIYTYGKIIRTRHDPNIIIDKDGYCLIALENNQCEIIAYTSIDREVKAQVSRYKWYLSADYAYNNQKGLLHVYLFPDAPEGLIRDHINRDKLDNRNKIYAL